MKKETKEHILRLNPEDLILGMVVGDDDVGINSYY